MNTLYSLLNRVVLTWIVAGYLVVAQGAGVLLEPYLGLEKGSWSTSYESSTASYDFITGGTFDFGVGFRTIIPFDHIFFGLDYYKGMSSFEYSEASGTTLDDSWQDVKADKTSIGLHFGAKNLSGKYAFWASYLLSDTLTLKQSHIPGDGAITYSGSGIQLGIGLQFRKYMRLNLLYSIHSYSERTQSGTTTELPGSSGGVTYQKYSHSSFFVGLSVPIFWKWWTTVPF
ncbi:MAG: hypothetical protein HN353_09995 [Bdellovibrionales bacterium]|nr:hypothetical protein [Bdellovibrionales bacterium]MBT3527231.1 hypothetical protein [Bdellovibrionales bacterium]MBT7668686.1 hypothetical protein [Bdellovibrionales bacterium]MBT7768323.1 hypothetical protein [Bdellovibrionales bacterium]